MHFDLVELPWNECLAPHIEAFLPFRIARGLLNVVVVAVVLVVMATDAHLALASLDSTFAHYIARALGMGSGLADMFVAGRDTFVAKKAPAASVVPETLLLLVPENSRGCE